MDLVTDVGSKDFIRLPNIVGENESVALSPAAMLFNYYSTFFMILFQEGSRLRGFDNEVLTVQ